MTSGGRTAAVDVSARAKTLVERAAVTCLHALLYMTVARPDRAVRCASTTCGATNRMEGTSRRGGRARRVRPIVAAAWRSPIESLLHLPLMTDPAQRATMDVLAAMVPAATLTDENLPGLASVRMAI